MLLPKKNSEQILKREICMAAKILAFVLKKFPVHRDWLYKAILGQKQLKIFFHGQIFTSKINFTGVFAGPHERFKLLLVHLSENGIPTV